MHVLSGTQSPSRDVSKSRYRVIPPLGMQTATGLYALSTTCMSAPVGAADLRRIGDLRQQEADEEFALRVAKRSNVLFVPCDQVRCEPDEPAAGLRLDLIPAGRGASDEETLVCRILNRPRRVRMGDNDLGQATDLEHAVDFVDDKDHVLADKVFKHVVQQDVIERLIVERESPSDIPDDIHTGPGRQIQVEPAIHPFTRAWLIATADIQTEPIPETLLSVLGLEDLPVQLVLAVPLLRPEQAHVARAVWEPGPPMRDDHGRRRPALEPGRLDATVVIVIFKPVPDKPFVEWADAIPDLTGNADGNEADRPRTLGNPPDREALRPLLVVPNPANNATGEEPELEFTSKIHEIADPP